MKRCIVVLLAVLAMPAPVLARVNSTDGQEAPIEDLTPASMPEQRAAVVAAFEPGERFTELDASGRAKVIEGFDRMQAIMGGASSISQLEPDAKVALFNEQALVNEILTQAQTDSRVTCKRNRTVNSRLKNSECHTVAEWDRRRERARKLADMNKRAVLCVSVPGQPGVCD